LKTDGARTRSRNHHQKQTMTIAIDAARETHFHGIVCEVE
jgi:hypothetical protein